MTRTKIGYVFCSLVILGVAIYCFQAYSILFRDDANERRVLITLHQRVHLGDDKKAVETMIYHKLGSFWQIRKGRNNLSVETPYIFGASNWNLYIAFKNGRVTTVFIRNSDTFKASPPNAPPDKGNYHHFL